MTESQGNVLPRHEHLNSTPDPVRMVPLVGDPPNSLSSLRVLSLLNPRGKDSPSNISYDKEDVEAGRQIREAFLRADKYVVHIGGGGLGDQILQSAYVEGLVYAIKHFRGESKPITLYVDPGLMGIYKDYEREGIEVLPIEVNEDDVLFSFNQQVNTMQGNIFALDLYGQGSSEYDLFPHFMQYNTSPGGSLSVESQATVVSNIWQPVMVEDYANHYGERRFAAHLGQLLGFRDNTFPEKVVQPHVPLPPDERKIYRELAEKFDIDTEAIQIAGIFQTAQPEKAYSIENWRVVIEQVKAAIATIQAGRNINFNVILGPVRETWSNILVDLMGEEKIRSVLEGAFADDPRVKMNFIQTNLSDLKVLLNHQDLVLADDTGPAHIAAHTTNGPEVVGAFLPYKFTKQTWAAGPRHHGVTLTPEEFAGFDEGDVRWGEVVGNPMVINAIPPERISKEAIKRYSRRLRKQKFIFGKVGKLLRLG